MTPFMLAVSGRAYPAAITVLEAAQKMAKGISSILFLSSPGVSFELKMCVVANHLDAKSSNQELIVTASILQHDQRRR